MPEWAEFIGALVRWSIKGFQTRFKDELAGIYRPLTKLSYDLENIILGYLTILIIGLIILLIM
jgi:hypothetical protein